jgi:hypothetical protein
LLIEPATPLAKATIYTLRKIRIVVASVETIAEIDFALNDPARIFEQICYVDPERTRIAGGFHGHGEASNDRTFCNSRI